MNTSDGYIVELTEDYYLDEIIVSEIEESYNTIWFDTEIYGHLRINTEYVDGIYQSKQQLDKIQSE